MYMSLIELTTLDSYEQHQAIWTLFPNTPDRKRDHLFRIENEQKGKVIALLQSSTEPESSPEVKVLQTKPFTLRLTSGEYCKFKIIANPTKRLSKARNVVELKTEPEQIEWLQRKLEGANVTVTSLSSKLVRNKKHCNAVFVTFEGILQINEAEKIQSAVVMGLGRKKHAGAGLLSLAKVN